MSPTREVVKYLLPEGVRNAIVDLRSRLSPPPFEDLVIRNYRLQPDPDTTPRLTLAAPTLAPSQVFGGIATGVELAMQCCVGAGADLRILLDGHDRSIDQNLLRNTAAATGFDESRLAVVPRQAAFDEDVTVRRNELFVAHNWWTFLNLKRLKESQERVFGLPRRPIIYLVQEYEPGFYSFSSTHLYARSALHHSDITWAIINSSQLQNYCHLQGHRFVREYVVEPRLNAKMRSYLTQGSVEKKRQILVYGRPTIPRNCFGALVKGLKSWAASYKDADEWSVMSAGQPHKPIDLGGRRMLRSLGKLTMDQYADRLLQTAVGVSLMSSPHPSYPPLEMAHFGIQTITNSYTCKDPSALHDNLHAVDEIDPDSIAGAISAACERFTLDPTIGWKGVSRCADYFTSGPSVVLNPLIHELREVFST